jgi:hypothetical protein
MGCSGVEFYAANGFCLASFLLRSSLARHTVEVGGGDRFEGGSRFLGTKTQRRWVARSDSEVPKAGARANGRAAWNCQCRWRHGGLCPASGGVWWGSIAAMQMSVRRAKARVPGNGRRRAKLAKARRAIAVTRNGLQLPSKYLLPRIFRDTQPRPSRITSLVHHSQTGSVHPPFDADALSSEPFRSFVNYPPRPTSSSHLHPTYPHSF